VTMLNNKYIQNWR